MELEKAVKDFLLEAEIKGFTKKTRDGYRRNLGMFCRYCAGEGITDTRQLDIRTIKGFTAKLRPGHKGTYLNGALKVVKSFNNYLQEEELGGIDPGKKFPWVQEDKPVIRAFTRADVRAILADCDPGSFTGIRDRAVISTMLETGVRCWELCCIRPDDVRDDQIIIHFGKNHKERAVPITAQLRKVLAKYETAKSDYFALREMEDYYFLSFHGRMLTNSAVEHILKRHGGGVTSGVRISPHTCRHTFAQSQLRMGTDIYSISRLLGHENLQITQIYLRSLRDEDIVQDNRRRSVLQSFGL